MKTSRVSRETAHMLSALSPGRRRSTRNSLQSFANEDFDGANDLPSFSSSVANGTVSAIGKRKRQDVALTRKGLAVEDISVRRSSSKLEKADDGEDNLNTKPQPRNPRKPRRQPAKQIKGPNGALNVEAPPNWETVYNVTAQMRKRILAPVDTMGCESLAEEHRSPKDQRLQTLVSLMLSSQTKDTVTAAAMKNLQANLDGGMCLESLLKVEPAELNRLIEKVGFHNNKTKYIKSTATILRDQYDGDIPSTIEGLVSLPGVGPKMAYLCMSAAWGRDEGIGVDVHVHRITNLWGWHKTSTPEQTRAELEAWLPKEKWHDINHLLVGFGQTICLPVGRRCAECDLAAQGLCPSAEMRKLSPVKKRVKKEVEVKIEDDEVVMVKDEQVVVQADDVGVKVEADLEENGQVEMQTMVGSATETEGIVG